MRQPKVSIIVTNFKQVHDLDLALNALLETHYPNKELIVIDCCTPNFNDWINEKYPTLKNIHFPKDVGIAALRNAGFAQIDKNSEYVCFIDDDVIVVPEWLDNIINLVEDNTDIGAVHPVRFNYTDKSKVDGLGNLMMRAGFPYKIEASEENLRKLKENKIMDVFYGETAAVLIRSEILFRLDRNSEPFDTDHFYAWEDVDLSWRIWLLGYRVVVTSGALCYHNTDLTGREAKLNDPRYSYLVTRGRFISMLKNYELPYLLKYLPLAVLIEISKSIVLLYYGPSHSIATIKGMIWGLIHFRYMVKKRSISRKPLTKRNSELGTVFMKTSPQALIRQFKSNWH